MNTQTVDTMIARVEYALDDAPGGEKAWVPLRRGDLVTMLRLLKVMPVMVDAAIQVMATLGGDAGISATAVVVGEPQPHGANGSNGTTAAVVSAWPTVVIPAPAPLQEAVTTVTEGPAVLANEVDLATIRKELAADEISWRHTMRSTRLALTDLVIRELANGDRLTMAEFDAKRPAFMPKADGLSKTFDLPWPKLVEKALQPRSGYAPKEVAVAPADSFRG